MMRNKDQKIAELENDPVSRLLGGLKRVEAPGDFDFRVKARIASGRPVNRPASWLPNTVRLAVPLGLLLLIGGYFGYNALYSVDNLAVAPVAVIQETLPVVDVMSTEPDAPLAKEVIARSVESKPAIPDINSKPTEKKIVFSAPSRRHVGGGSYVETRGISTPLRPKSATVSAKDILSFMGIAADSSWKIGSVTQNSMADRSGLKAGDVIEAINDQNLTEKATFGNKFSSKTIRVRRGDKSMLIDLKP